jgi:serine/threonine protein kinase
MIMFSRLCKIILLITNFDSSILNYKATGSPPWSELNPYAALYAIANSDTPPPELPPPFSREAVDFVNKCLTRDVSLRPDAQGLLDHTFLDIKSATI